MRLSSPHDQYSAREIARAAGVTEREVRAALGPARDFVGHEEAVGIGRMLVAVRQSATRPSTGSGRLDLAEGRIPQSRGVPLFLSSTLHIAAMSLLILATFNLAPRAAALKPDDPIASPMRLVFLAAPGPGGGGGGGGLLQKAPPPKARREGRKKISSPMPKREPPKPIEPIAAPPEPTPAPLAAEALPVVIAP